VGADPAIRTVEAVVVEQLPQLKFRVKLANQQIVLAHPVGNTKRNFVRLLPGDRVEVELTPHDWSRGRIVKKLG
jgi:translation initiation factor IF-1